MVLKWSKIAVFFLLCVPATGNIECTSEDFKRKIELVGDPVCKVKVSWQSPITLASLLVTYRIYYFKTTPYRECNCQRSPKELITSGPYCTRQSSKPGEWLQYVLDKQTVNGLNISFADMETICIAIEKNYNNRTFYSFDDCTSPFETNGPNCVITCPPPDGFRVRSFKNRTLAVTFDSPKCVHGKGRFDIFYHIKYRPVREATDLMDPEFQDIEIHNNLNGFKETNNEHLIISLAPATKYEVKMCCTFGTSLSDRCNSLSRSYFASTLEEAPSRPPIVIEALRMGESLKFLFKNPPSGARNGNIIMYGFEIWRSGNHDCTAGSDYSKTFIERNFTTQDINKDKVNITYRLKQPKGNYCLHVKVRNSVAWSPWSATHNFPDETPQIETSRTRSPKSYVVVIIIVAVCVIVIIAAVIFCWLYGGRFFNRNQEQQQYEDPGEEDIFLTTDIPSATPSTEDQDNNIYAEVLPN